jgi:heptosyltransferase-2
MQRPARVPTRHLVVAPNWIGDALMALPLLATLKHHSPHCHITLLAPSAVAELLANSPLVDQVIATPWPHGGLQFWARLALARKLRREQFDSALVLPNSAKSALLPFLAGITRRVGYLGESRRLLLSSWLANTDRSISMVERYLALAALLGAPATAGQVPAATLKVDPLDVSRIKTRLGLDPARLLVVFCPGAEYGPAKRWPPRHFARLAELVSQTWPSVLLVLAGAKGDFEGCEEIVQATRAPILNLAGQTSISEVTALLAGAALVVSNDSGLMHIASCLNRPLVALYGSTDPRHTPPGAADARVLWLHTSCSPCFARVCPLGHMRCLVEITPESVFAAIPSGALH